MKMLKFKKLSKKTLIISVSVLALVAVGTVVYAVQPKKIAQNDTKSVASVTQTKDIDETSAKVVEPADSTPTAVEQVPAASQTQQSASSTETANDDTQPAETVDPALEKQCEQLNSSIAHIKTTFAARGSEATNKDILQELSTNQMNKVVYSYYAQCVAAGKTASL